MQGNLDATNLPLSVFQPEAFCAAAMPRHEIKSHEGTTEQPLTAAIGTSVEHFPGSLKQRGTN
uniref:Uncharacterized protein n=1 Tax=Arundo donax TaxID=35708 RepID=A0A0A8Y648_ARUDO